MSLQRGTTLADYLVVQHERWRLSEIVEDGFPDSGQASGIRRSAQRIRSSVGQDQVRRLFTDHDRGGVGVP